MNFQELNQNEMATINGGGLLDGTNLIQGNLIGPVTIGNMLSLSVNSQSGVTALLATGPLTNLTNGLNLGGLMNGLNLSL
ncbi:bacteriocin [Pedobacter sp. MC2016-15]|uniref:bacteriocin n=1 Tax=Pedobacter sp. MC2016-15 TaxID=2994473 RepID=UPI0022481C61|nr:bacteriocin [Pedobacter sp. MC2016-15]MCX2478707.1 bacteriocin [Pedobacter sp. MC2016-15]